MIVNLKADPRRTPGDYTVYFLLDSLSSTRYKPVDGVQDADTKGEHDRARYTMRMIISFSPPIRRILRDPVRRTVYRARCQGDTKIIRPFVPLL